MAGNPTPGAPRDLGLTHKMLSRFEVPWLLETGQGPGAPVNRLYGRRVSDQVNGSTKGLLIKANSKFGSALQCARGPGFLRIPLLGRAVNFGFADGP